MRRNDPFEDFWDVDRYFDRRFNNMFRDFD